LGIDPARVSISVNMVGFANGRRREVGGAQTTNVAVTVAVSPAATTGMQYALSCLAPTAAATCASAQAVLLAAGVSSSGCNVTSGLLRAVVWGDDVQLAGSLAAFCNSTVSLGELPPCVCVCVCVCVSVCVSVCVCVCVMCCFFANFESLGRVLF
jgi:hypothetical protein